MSTQGGLRSKITSWRRVFRETRHVEQPSTPSHRQQIILTAVALLLLVFSLIVYRMAGRAAVADAGHSLAQQTKIMAGTLDTFFDNAKARGSPLSAGQGTMMTGDVDSPVLKVGNETGNANRKRLEDFKTREDDRQIRPAPETPGETGRWRSACRSWRQRRRREQSAAQSTELQGMLARFRV